MKKKLLLHCCCGPCSSYVLTELFEKFDVTVLFYNPNIFPKDEFEKRHKQLKKLIEVYNVKEIEISYKEDEFLSQIISFEKEKEGGKRCEICFRLRLFKTAEKAKELSFEIFTTTLSVSPHKNSSIINEIGKEASNYYKVDYLFADFKKKDGFKKSIELSKKYELYRQNYCGCRFSLKK